MGEDVQGSPMPGHTQARCTLGKMPTPLPTSHAPCPEQASALLHPHYCIRTTASALLQGSLPFGLSEGGDVRGCCLWSPLLRPCCPPPAIPLVPQPSTWRSTVAVKLGNAGLALRALDALRLRNITLPLGRCTVLCARCAKNGLLWTRFPQYCSGSSAIAVVWPNMVIHFHSACSRTSYFPPHLP